MAMYKIPVKKEVPAYAEVEIEANTLEEACLLVQADIHKLGINSDAAEAEFTADWSEAHDLALAEVMLPEGRIFPAKL